MKKTKKGEGITTSPGDNTGSEPNDDSADQNNMAAPSECKQDDEKPVESTTDGASSLDKTTNGIGQRIRLQARRSRNGKKAGLPGDDGEETATDDDNKTVPTPKIPSRRGRPKKRTLSVDPVSTSRDVFSMLMEIRNELDIQKEDNHTIKSEMVKDISGKLEKLKTDVCQDLRVMKSDMHVHSDMLKYLDKTQGDHSRKLVDIETKCNELEHDLDRGIVETDEKISKIEHSLVEHIEVLKVNVEEKLHEQDGLQINLEQKLSDFTVELDIENRRMRMDIDGLTKKMNELHNKVEGDYWEKISHGTSKCSCSCTGSLKAESINSEHTLYLFGDTSKSIVIDHVRENITEELKKLVIRCFHDINIDVSEEDVTNVERIGAYNPKNRRPRPVKVTFKESGVRDQILYFKSRLRYSQFFKEFKISKEEPRDVRIKRAKLRQAALIAKNKGLDVFITFDFVRIEGVNYDIDNIDTVPAEFTIAGQSPKTPPKFRRDLSLERKCKWKAEKAVIIGPSLQKTVRGLAFSSANCFLSNFFPCTVFYRGSKFSCTEQGYQFMKAKIHLNEKAMKEIMEARTPLDMKRAGETVITDERWERDKFNVMEELLWAKFRQNKELYFLLMNTRPYDLIESTMDKCWGAGCLMGSIALDEGVWEGENHLGRMLMYIRKKFEMEMDSK